ncbi:hypothetical protein ACFFRR_003050 [Megaselia abdita]
MISFSLLTLESMQYNKTTTVPYLGLSSALHIQLSLKQGNQLVDCLDKTIQPTMTSLFSRYIFNISNGMPIPHFVLVQVVVVFLYVFLYKIHSLDPSPSSIIRQEDFHDLFFLRVLSFQFELLLI